MKISLRPHLKKRLKERQIPQNYPSRIVSSPDNQYFDVLRNHQIAIKKLKYDEKLRPMVMAYDIIEGEIQIITIYPTQESEIDNRIKSGRWVKNEKS